MRSALELAKARGFWFYVTDDSLPNPWDTLPPYWNTELLEARRLATPVLSLSPAAMAGCHGPASLGLMPSRQRVCLVPCARTRTSITAGPAG